MIWLAVAIGGLVALGSLLAVAEAATSRMTRIRAMALREEGRRNAALLEEIESDPPRYLNSIYLAVMFARPVYARRRRLRPEAQTIGSAFEPQVWVIAVPGGRYRGREG